jgi:hypothetical protein
VSRPAIAEGLAVLWMVGLSAVQWLVNSPHIYTEVEWHVMLLFSVPSLTVVLSAHWVDAGRHDRR